MIFRKETVQQASSPQDPGKLAEIPKHELLRVDSSVVNESIASFEQVLVLGKLFLEQLKSFNHDLIDRHQRTVNTQLLANFVKSGQTNFWGILQLSGSSEQRFPVTAEIVETPKGKNIILYVVPVSISALETQQFQNSTESMLALAAGALSAPHFLLALKGGITTEKCSSKKMQVSAITPDHGTPLAATFEAFDNSFQTLEHLTSITRNDQINIQQAAHLHGKSKLDADSITQASTRSKITAGIPLHQISLTEIPLGGKLLVPTSTNQNGGLLILSTSQFLKIGQVLWENDPYRQKDAYTLDTISDLSLLAATLGFTAQVVGDENREQLIEKVIDPKHSSTPLRDVIS